MRSLSTVEVPNLKFARLDMEGHIKRSRLSKVWLEKYKPVSEKHGSSISNLMRILLLHKYGGAYLDSDTISKQPIPADIPNFVVSRM